MNKKTFGFYNYSYLPYALGDTITWLMNVKIQSEINKSKFISLNIFIDKNSPSSNLQKFITKYNYHKYIDELIRVFSIIDPNELNIINQKNLWDLQIKEVLKNGNNSWPRLFPLILNKLNFSSHNYIDKFYRKNGFLPNLVSSRKRSLKNDLLEKKYKKKVILVNFRQTNFSDNPNALDRDSDESNWIKFFKHIEKEDSKILFILLGEIERYSNKLLFLNNVLSLRDKGFNLKDEIELILSGTPFFGTSSGFSAVATFSQSPYYILRYEHVSARYVNLRVGDEKFIFSNSQQFISWEEDSIKNLKKCFNKLLNKL